MRQSFSILRHAPVDTNRRNTAELPHDFLRFGRLPFPATSSEEPRRRTTIRFAPFHPNLVGACPTSNAVMSSTAVTARATEPFSSVRAGSGGRSWSSTSRWGSFSSACGGTSRPTPTNCGGASRRPFPKRRARKSKRKSLNLTFISFGRESKSMHCAFPARTAPTPFSSRTSARNFPGPPSGTGRRAFAN